MSSPTTTAPADPPDSRPSLPDRLQHVDLLAACTRRDRRIVARHLEVLRVPSGTVLVRAGDPGTNVYLVLAGTVEVSRGDRRARLGAGRHVGEIALLRGVPAPDDVVAVTECEIAVLGARMFRVLCRDLPPLTRALLSDLAARADAFPVHREVPADRSDTADRSASARPSEPAH